MPNAQRLITQLEKTEYGDEIITALLEIFRDQASALALKMWLDKEIRRLSSRDQVKTPSEQAVMAMLDDAPAKELGLQEICDSAEQYELKSLQKLGHASRVVNSLASKGIVGKWRMHGGRGRPKTRFGSPDRAVLNVLTQMDVMPSEADEEVIIELADITGMPLAKIVNVLAR